MIPGQTLKFEMWQENNRIHFETSVVETNTVVITGKHNINVLCDESISQGFINLNLRVCEFVQCSLTYQQAYYSLNSEYRIVNQYQSAKSL